MSFPQDNVEIQEWVEKYGDIYCAVRAWGTQASELMEAYGHKISESEALNWIMHGIKPDFENRRSYPDAKQAIVDEYVNTFLELVDDKQIVSAVRESIRRSINSYHLVYFYNNIEDQPRRARCRILTRLIWYELKPNYHESED